MGKVNDLGGRTFGRLTVLEYIGISNRHLAIWKCQCVCGNIVEVVGHSLVTGNTNSCGCYMRDRASDNTKDLTGLVFGRLTVLSRFGIRKDRHATWLCLCSCGKETVEVGSRLRSGETSSCGCLNREITSKRTTTHGRSRTRSYQIEKANRRREKEHIFDCGWTPEMTDAIMYFFAKCVVCGGTDRLSIDHVLPLDKGYGLKPGNAVVLCIHCNCSKGDFDLDKLPLTLPVDSGQLIAIAASEFENYWYSLVDSRKPIFKEIV